MGDRIDEFASLFRSADKVRFNHEPPVLQKLVLVSDLPAAGGEALLQRVRSFLQVLADGLEFLHLGADDYQSEAEVFDKLGALSPSLVVCYRNLRQPAGAEALGMGGYVEYLIGSRDFPVMLIPHPDHQSAAALQNTDSVLAVTDHLAGDHNLVNHAAAFTQPGGTLFLTHLEDGRVFERYVEVIGKIPEFNTDSARQRLERQLLKEPADYIGSCAQVLREAGVDVTIESIVRMGHSLDDYRAIIQAREIDLVVLETRDESHIATRGIALVIAHELRSVPLLLI